MFVINKFLTRFFIYGVIIFDIIGGNSQTKLSRNGGVYRTRKKGVKKTF